MEFSSVENGIRAEDMCGVADLRAAGNGAGRQANGGGPGNVSNPVAVCL